MEIVNVGHLKQEYVYSETYEDDMHIYRHVTIPKAIWKVIQKSSEIFNTKRRLLSEAEWRSLGIRMSRGSGWYQYALRPNVEANILLFRRLHPVATPPTRKSERLAANSS